MAECNKCKSAIRGESGIKCEGICGKIYHSASKCSNIDQYSIGILNKHNFIRFICDDCVHYIHNIEELLREIHDGVEKNKQQLNEYKHEFKATLKRNENEIKELLEAIENRYEERIKKLDFATKNCEKNVKEMINLSGRITEFENNNKEMSNTINDNNIRMCNEIKKAIKNTNEKTNQISYAQAVKNKVMPDVEQQVPLIIKPKEKQNIEKTKEELNNKVDPVNLKIKNIENRKNGTVVIQTDNENEREKIKIAIQKEMSDGYDIMIPNTSEKKIIISDMTFKHTEMELLQKIRKQNPIVTDGQYSIIKMFEYKKFNKTIYNAKLKIDSESYHKLMDERKINIGWEKCRIFDGTEIIQCFKCRGYNHKAVECKNNEICLKCHGAHKSKECNNEILKKCINCIRNNQKLNLGLDDNHYTSSRSCPVYQNKLNFKKKQRGINF